MQHAYPQHHVYAQRPPVRRDLRDAELRIRDLVRPNVGPFVGGLVAGALAGASVGIWSGAISALVGLLIGAVVGLCSGLAMDYVETRERVHQARLDRDIGVFGGEIGAGAALRHPEPTYGTYSVESTGYYPDQGGFAPAEGPFVQPE